ncbi:MAG TPA: RusA family crossover junction endodeoxyribonuclease [Burkholderiaceae bacterium]|nr:RusA family crossover junction endodeoxyribonuclease [Burkholderiaceae bacterium]
MIRLTLPLPVSKNRKYRRGSDGRPKLARAVVTFREEVWLAVKQAHLRKITGPCRAEVVIHPRDARAIDAHNYTEQLYDALERAGLIENDRQFTDCHVRLGEIVRPAGACEVTITEIK